MTGNVRTLGSLPLMAVGLLALPLPARADVKIVSEVKVSSGGEQSPSSTRIQTTYYKGRKARLESADGTIILYDREADKVYTVSPAQKTYYVQSFKDALKADSQLPETLKKQVSVETKVDLDEVKDSVDQKRSVAGREANRYTLFSTIAFNPKTTTSAARPGGGGGFPGGGGGGGFPGGGRRGGGGGGGFPGGGGGGGMPPGGGGGGMPPGGGGTPPGGGAMVQIPRSSLSGNVWVTDALSLLPNGKKDEKEMVSVLLRQTLPANSPALGDMADRLAKKHLLPLASHIIVRTSDANNPSGGNGGTSGNAGNGNTGAQSPLVIQMAVTSIETGTTLSEDIFRLPDGYERIEPPTMPIPTSPGRGAPPAQP
jgi:hypothetical protein